MLNMRAFSKSAIISIVFTSTTSLCVGFALCSSRPIQLSQPPSARQGESFCSLPFQSRSTTTTFTSTALFAKKKKSSPKKKKKPSSPSKPKKSKPASFGFSSTAGKWDNCEPLRTWMRQNGAGIEGVSVGIVNPTTGLRGTYAARDFARGDPVFSVPREACILDETKADASTMARYIYPTSLQREALPPPIRTALLLLWLQRIPSIPSASDDDMQQAAHWKPYLDMLPTPTEFESQGGPMQLWSTDEIAQVECPQLIAEVTNRKATLHTHYTDRVLTPWTQASNILGPPPTFEEFQHAVCIVTTRNYGQGSISGGSSSMLIPGVDLANHEDPPKANTKYGLSPWGDFVLLATKSIPKGEEILSTYGPLPNRLLLAQFGFLLPNRIGTERQLMSDVALVRLDGLFPDSLSDSHENEVEGTLSIPEAEVAADMKWTNGPGPTMLVNLRGNKDAQGRVARWQPITAAPAATRTMFADTAKEEEEEVDEKAALALQSLVQRELNAYSTSLEEDEASLEKEKGLGVREEMALRFRIEAKRLLKKELVGAQEMQVCKEPVM